MLASLDHDVSRRGAYVAYIGSRELPVRVRVLGAEALAAGRIAGAVRLFLDTALPLLPGDRYVLRESGRDETIGGGEVLDIDPVARASRARPDRSIERVVRERGWVDVDELELLTGETVDPTVGRWVTTPRRARSRPSSGCETAVGDAGELGLDDGRARRARTGRDRDARRHHGRHRPRPRRPMPSTRSPITRSVDVDPRRWLHAGDARRCRPDVVRRADPSWRRWSSGTDRVPHRRDRRRRPRRRRPAGRGRRRVHRRASSATAPARAASSRCRSSPNSTPAASHGAVTISGSPARACPDAEASGRHLDRRRSRSPRRSGAPVQASVVEFDRGRRAEMGRRFKRPSTSPIAVAEPKWSAGSGVGRRVRSRSPTPKWAPVQASVVESDRGRRRRSGAPVQASVDESDRGRRAEMGRRFRRPSSSPIAVAEPIWGAGSSVRRRVRSRSPSRSGAPVQASVVESASSDVTSAATSLSPGRPRISR